MSKSLSPAVAAALAMNPKLAQIPRAQSTMRDIPPMPRRALKGSYPIPVAQTYAEAVAALKEKYYANDLQQRAGVEGNALWAGMSLRNADQADAVESALVRIDKAQERTKRYRLAHGRERAAGRTPQFYHMLIRRNMRIFPDTLARLRDLAKRRGESLEACERYVIESGLILADERSKRYEAWMLTQMIEHVGEARTIAKNENDAVRAAREKIEPDRYVDPASPSLERATNLAQPMFGAPTSVAALVLEYPKPKEMFESKEVWY